jgi:hypothetical protein
MHKRPCLLWLSVSAMLKARGLYASLMSNDAVGRLDFFYFLDFLNGGVGGGGRGDEKGQEGKVKEDGWEIIDSEERER